MHPTRNSPFGRDAVVHAEGAKTTEKAPSFHKITSVDDWRKRSEHPEQQPAA